MQKSKILLKTVWKKWRKITYRIGNFQARVILTIFYFTILLPVAIPVTLFSDRFRKKKPQKTVWQPWKENYQTLEEATRQF